MRGAATASGAAAAASCTKHPHAKIRAAPTGRRRTKQCASGAGRGSPRPWESTAPPVDGAAAAADGAMRALRREARKGRCYLLSGAVARVGLAEGRGLFLKLFAGGSHGAESCVESWACANSLEAMALVGAAKPKLHPNGRT